MPLFSPVSAGGIGKATVTATTGSPSIDSVTRAGKTIYRFTGSGTITIGSGGTCEILVVGGGGGGGGAYIYGCGGGGGAGQLIYDTNFILPAGATTITIGAGGGKHGNSTRLGSVYAMGGGGGSNHSSDSGARYGGQVGASGGGGGYSGGPEGSVNSNAFGFAGGSAGSQAGGGGGGGSTSVGSNNSGGTGGAGGTGTGGTYNIPGEPGRVTSRSTYTVAIEYTEPNPIPQGGPETFAKNVTGATLMTGDGGRSLLGNGGSGSLSAAVGSDNNPDPDFGINGRAGDGYGAGASGQVCNGSTTTTGASGSPGIVIVEEFY